MVFSLAMLFVLLAAACGGERAAGNGTASTAPATATTSRSTLASAMVFGSGPECPHEPYCLPGLEKVYGLSFRSFAELDAGGPKTVAALKKGDIQVGVLFTTDGRIPAEKFVLLEDDKKLQPAENVTPIVRTDLTASHGPGLGTTLDSLSAKLTTAALTDLNRKVDVDGMSNVDVAKEWLRDSGFLADPAGTPPPSKAGPPIVVGSANFSESKTLGELYAHVLEANGYPVQRNLGLGNRATYLPKLEKGEIGVIPEYLGSLLGYLDPSASASADAAATYRSVQEHLGSRGLGALQPAPAENKNGIVVTGPTAERYHLGQVSDLGSGN